MRSAVSLTLLCTLTLERAPTPAARRAPAPPALARASAAPLRSSVPPRSPRERLLSELWFALRLRDRQALARCLSARHGPRSVERLLAPMLAKELRDRVVRRFDEGRLARLVVVRQELDRIAGGLRAADVLALKTRGERREGPGRLALSLPAAERDLRLVLVEEGGEWLLDEFDAASEDTCARLSEVERALREGGDEWAVDVLRATLPGPKSTPAGTK